MSTTSDGVRTIAQRLRMESLAAAINFELIKMRNAGTLEDMYKKWFLSSSQCYTDEDDEDVAQDTPPSFAL